MKLDEITETHVHVALIECQNYAAAAPDASAEEYVAALATIAAFLFKNVAQHTRSLDQAEAAETALYDALDTIVEANTKNT